MDPFDSQARDVIDEYMQTEGSSIETMSGFISAALRDVHAASYRAGLEAAAKEYDAEDLAGVRVYCRHVAQHIRSLPVPGEAPAIRTVPMMPVDPEADARIEELRAKQPPETARKIAAPPAPDPTTARETILRALYAARRPLTQARRLGALSGEEAARLAELEKRIDEEEAFEDAAALGGEDAEALLRECEKALLAVRDSKYLAKAWRSVPVIRALVDRAVARLAAPAGGRSE